MSAIALLGLTLVACGESKVAQCNRLISVANDAETALQGVIDEVDPDDADPDDAEALNTIADIADQAGINIQALEFEDEQLQDYQGRFVTMYQEINRAIRAIYTTVSVDNDAAQQAVTDLETVVGQERDLLVNEVNTYCGAS